MRPDDYLHDWVEAEHHRVVGRCRRCRELRQGTAPVLFEARVRDDKVRLRVAASRAGKRSPNTQRMVDELGLAGHPDTTAALDVAYNPEYSYLSEPDTGRGRFPFDKGPARRPPELRCHRCGWAPRIPRRDLWAKVKKMMYADEHVVYV